MEELLFILDARIPLSNVVYEQTGNLVWRCCLTFGSKAIVVSVGAEFDELLFTQGLTIKDDVKEMENSPLWENAIGLPLYSSWRMLSHQGHYDGVQLQFAQTVESDCYTIQMLGVGSTLQFSTVQMK